MLFAFLNAQALTGKVTDSQTGDPLVGAQVFVKGTFVGTTTDVSGSYFLDVEGDVTVLVAYMGYKNPGTKHRWWDCKFFNGTRCPQTG